METLESRLGRIAHPLLSVYVTAGYPHRDSLPRILRALDAGGADLVEVGIPFSDPIADGPTIQAANQQALDQGMSLHLLLSQVESVLPEIQVPVVLMGYFNSVLQYGVEAFLHRAQQAGVAGLILPDLPPEPYETTWKPLFEQYGLGLTFLVTPRSTEARIRHLDSLTQGFLYIVSSAAITGGTGGVQAAQTAYFERLRALHLRKPQLIGFGISSPQDFETAAAHARGAILGSAFIRHLHDHGDSPAAIQAFLTHIRPTLSPETL